jgi:digeranylgeranylglycerophospholipid reductase
VIADVLVIGAGPAGAMAGQQIARAGYKVLIFEKNCSHHKNKALGCALSRKSFTDLNLPEEMIERECSNLVYHFPEERLLVSNSSGFVLFDRAALDHFLIRRTEENGAKLLHSTLVTDVIRCDDGITVHYRELATGEMREARGRIVIFADGTSTLAYKKFQIGFEGRPEVTALGAAYDFIYPKNNLGSMDIFFSEKISPFGYGWIFPRKETVNVGVLCLLSKIKYDINRYLDNFVSSAALNCRQIVGYSSRLVPQSCVEKLHCDSVLIAGDAAGTADPIDGSGLFNAAVSGQLSGKVAVEALDAGKVTTDFLARYEDEWMKTENYKLFRRSYLLRRLSLKADVSLGVFLKKMGFFENHAST